MALHEPWSIKSRAHACSVTEQKFTDGQLFFTAIFPDPETSGYLRKDFNEEAWKDRGADAPKPFSFWSSTYHVPVKEDEVTVTDESPEDLLRRLIEEDEEYTENVRYILAIMLERKKQLVEADSQPTPTGIIRIYEHRKSGDVFIVKDPNIPLAEVESIQDEVFELLEHGGRKPKDEVSIKGNGETVADGGEEQESGASGQESDQNDESDLIENPEDSLS